MVKALKTSQGKVLTLNGDVLTTTAIVPTGTLNITENDTYDVTNYASAVVSVSGGGDIIEAINNTGAAISADDKVYIAPLETPQSGADYELIEPKIAPNPLFGFLSCGSSSFPTINTSEKSVSGFYSGSDWLRVPRVMDYTQPWEFNCCFQTGSDISSSSSQYIFYSNTTRWGDSGFLLYLYHGELTTSFNDSSVHEIAFFHSYNVSANTTYYVKAGWTGTQYYAKYSTDGVNWTEDAESPYSSQTQTFQNSSEVILGNNSNTTSLYFQGKIFMDKTYMTSGDSIQWQMYSDGASNIGADVVTGIANESIASGSVGEVTTLLGE